eukprot:TRINITY_DN2742_c0_g1_i1.p1 TRINITY_DN2742_c0_g1~~TRINITY_DN2742_c0_g1_i1.p1  ORF type:complete len:507 (-),score=128.15 TRINITY_DN2742_c0_g1_i1:197-1717(-)
MSRRGYATSMLPAPALHPGCDHQLQSMSLDTVRTFALRALNFYQALAMIARPLSSQDRSASEAMELVTTQHKWMRDVFCAVGIVIGTFDQLEKNTSAELQLVLAKAQQDMPVGFMKKIFRDTLELMAGNRKRFEYTIKTCEDYAKMCIQWHGREFNVQHAVMELFQKSGGSAGCEAIEEIRKCTEALTKAQENASKAFKRVAELRGSQEEAECQALVLESIANNEKGSQATLVHRAEEADQNAANNSMEADSIFNMAYKVRKHGFLSSWYETDWVGNKDNVASWRAERFVYYAEQAKGAESEQQEQCADKAAKAVAEVKKELAMLKAQSQNAEQYLQEKDDKVRRAKMNLLDMRKRSDALSEAFGIISSFHIAALRDHMQKFPELLGAQGMEDSGMFASMKGALLQHQRLCKRMQLFLEEPDDAQCKYMLKDLTPAISQAIADAQFFSKRMEPLKNKMDACLQQMPAPQALPQHSQSDSIALDNASDGSFEKVNMRGEADSDDELW